MRGCLLLLLALLALASVAHANRCKWKGYDFSSLKGFVLQSSLGDHEAYLSMCSRLSRPSWCTDTGSTTSACLLQRSPTKARGVGRWPNDDWVHWSWIEPNAQYRGVQYEMDSGEMCGEGEERAPCRSVVRFECARSQGPLNVTLLGSHTHLWTLPTPLACLPPEPVPVPGCQFEGRDYSGLAQKDLLGSDGGATFEYSLHVCGEMESPECRGLETSSCMLQRRPPAPAIVTGKWPLDGKGVQWRYMDESAPERGVQYELIGARNCWASGSATNFRVLVQLACAREQQPVRVEQFACSHNYTVPTPLACPWQATTRLALD